MGLVIGKFQNPWLEINSPGKLADLGIPFARRCSGGGTVFHDLGNVNISYLQPKSVLKKRENLQFVADFLKSEFNKDVSINERGDLIYQNKKISGSANRIEKERSIHHFTLLLNSDLLHIRKFLGKGERSYEIESTATRSVPSPVNNLFDQNSEKCPNFDEFAQKFGSYCVQNTRLEEKNASHDNWIMNVNPTDFEAVKKQSELLRSWDWLYGLTPKFKFTVILEECNGLKVSFELAKARVRKVTCYEGNENFEKILSDALHNVEFRKGDLCEKLASISGANLTEKCVHSLVKEINILPIF